MATIGNFTKSGDRYTGAVRTLTLNVKAQIAPAEKENDKAPENGPSQRPEAARVGNLQRRECFRGS